MEPFNVNFSGITGWGIDLDYCDIEWLALETNSDYSVIFEIAPKYCIWLFCWLWGLFHFFSGILAYSSIYNGYRIKFTHSSPF